MMWVEKYRPGKAEDMVGNEEARARFLTWLSGWERGAKPLLIVGPPGSGKTTLATAGARQLGYMVMELNASDARRKADLEGRVRALGSTSLMQEKRLLFLDEVDGLFGRADFGGLEFLAEALKELTLPVVMAANFESSDQVKKLAKLSTVVRMNRVPDRLIEMYVKEILRKEKVSIPEEAIRSLVVAARGDMRAAINNVQAASTGGEGVQPLRDRPLSVSEALEAAMAAANLERAETALRECEASPEERLSAAFTSIVAAELPLEVKREALRSLTRANELLGHILRSQRWRQLRYFDSLLAQALVGVKAPYVEDDLPWPLKLRIWNDGRYLRAFQSYLARRYRISRGDATAFYLHATLLVLGKDPSLLKGLCDEAGLEEKVANALEREYELLVGKLGR
jgi:replication factor C large subunit